MSTKTDFVIYNEEFHSGVTELLEQAAIDLRNGANGTIQIVTQSLLGDFSKETFFDLIDNLVQERDPTSTADVVPSGLSHSEHVSPKVNRRIGPHVDTLDKFKKINKDPSIMSFILGQQSAKAVMLDYLNTGLIALSAAIKSEPELVYNADADANATKKTANPLVFIKGLSKMGDASSRIRSWVMPSKPFFDMVEDAVLEKVTGISDIAVYGGMPGSQGLPVYKTDSAALIETGRVDGTGNPLPNLYTILGLTENALVLTQSENYDVVSERKGGGENILASFQAETAYNITIKGFSYVGAGASPTKAQLGTTANWSRVVSDVKSAAGVAIVVQ